MNKCQFCVVKLGKQELCDDCLARYDVFVWDSGELLAHWGFHGLRRWGFILDLSYEVEDL